MRSSSANTVPRFESTYRRVPWTVGVAVMPWPLVADYVRAGRLVAPFGFRRAESAFALLAAPGVNSRALDQFRTWLIAEGAKTPAPPS